MRQYGRGFKLQTTKINPGKLENISRKCPDQDLNPEPPDCEYKDMLNTCLLRNSGSKYCFNIIDDKHCKNVSVDPLESKAWGKTERKQDDLEVLI